MEEINNTKIPHLRAVRRKSNGDGLYKFLHSVLLDEQTKNKKVVKGGIKMEPLAGVAKDLYALIFRFSHGKTDVVT